MDKLQLDELYHNLRELYLTSNAFEKEAVAGIVTHLADPAGNYIGLLRFLSYYGKSYILPSVIKLLQTSSHTPKFSRIFELGAGFGWLGRGISNTFGVPVTFCDKRQWVFIDIVADIETVNGVKRVLDELKDGDLIIMSELLHCLENPRDVLHPFTKWPMLVVEYDPENTSYKKSYNAQIEKFGCKPVISISSVFPEAEILTDSTDTHKIWLVLPA